MILNHAIERRTNTCNNRKPCCNNCCIGKTNVSFVSASVDAGLAARVDGGVVGSMGKVSCGSD